MPGTNAGTGCPIAFRCHGERRLTDERRGGHVVHVTGRERKAQGNRNARMDVVAREYVCSCGHTGWSRHIDLQQRKRYPLVTAPAPASYGPEVDALLVEADALGEAANVDVSLLSRLARALWRAEERGTAVEVLKMAEAAVDLSSSEHCYLMALVDSVIGSHLKALVWLARHLVARGVKVDMEPGYGTPTATWLRDNPGVLVMTPDLEHSVLWVDGLIEAGRALRANPHERAHVLRDLGWLDGRDAPRAPATGGGVITPR